MLDSIGNVLTYAALLIWAWLILRRRLPALGGRLLDMFMVSAPEPADVQDEGDRSLSVRAPEPLPDAAFAEVQRSNVQAEPAGLEAPTLQELRQLARAIEHNARGANKQQSLEAAFGVKKGGSASWRRASQLFDEAMKEPEDVSR